MVIEEGVTLNIYDKKTYRKKTEAKVITTQPSDNIKLMKR